MYGPHVNLTITWVLQSCRGSISYRSDASDDEYETRDKGLDLRPDTCIFAPHSVDLCEMARFPREEGQGFIFVKRDSS